MLRLSDSQITIEQTNAQNYLSWISNRLIYSGETLGHVSRQLERLYNVEITFESEQIKRLKLTADIERTNLKKVLDTISGTFDMRYKMNGHKVVWMP